MTRPFSPAAALAFLVAAAILVGSPPWTAVAARPPASAAPTAPRLPLAHAHHHAHPHPHGAQHDHDHGLQQQLDAMSGRSMADDAAGVAPLLGTLGAHTHPITTASALAQRYFDEGLVLTFGFNHAEAIRAFTDAITLDPACAMCHWGIAYALGPNINAAMEAPAVPVAHAAIQQAQQLALKTTESERAYIQALVHRYAAEPVADRAYLDLAYAHQMRELMQRYPEDLDAATLFAEALMDLTPWNFWTKDGHPTAHTPEIVAVLESVLARHPDHPFANHLYIHATEASQTPERAIPSAERLERLVPGAGHLVHMPAHVYWRVGRYADAVRVNERAIGVDEVTIGTRGADLSTHSFYSLAYYPHNIHFVFAGAQMSGRGELALTAARKLVGAIPAEAYAAIPPLEDFRPMPLFGLARFGRWEAILAEPPPAAELRYTTGVWHWARGLAYVRQGDAEAAEREYAALMAIAGSGPVQQQPLASFAQAGTILQLAGHVLAGELAGARGQPDAAIAELEAAVTIQDGLAYIEPPAWFYPVRQNLGAALLAAGRAAEAEAVYREDLRQYPANGWSLYGLAASLRAQGKAAEAAEAQRRFDVVWRDADVTLTASRF